MSSYTRDTLGMATALIFGMSNLVACNSEGETARVSKRAADQHRSATVAKAKPLPRQPAPSVEVPKIAKIVVPPSEIAPLTTASTAVPKGVSATGDLSQDGQKLGFDDLLDRADALGVDGKTEDAIRVYEMASKRDPKSAVPHVEIARLLIKSKRLELAREHAELAIELSPGWSTAWNTLGRIDLVAGRLDDAAEAFNQAAKANDANIYAWNNLGLVRIMQRRFDEAAEALEQAARSDDAIAYMLNNLGTAYEQLGRKSEALAAYKRGLSLGSHLAGKNFVRLERELGLTRTAQRPLPASGAHGRAATTKTESDPS